MSFSETGSKKKLFLPPGLYSNKRPLTGKTVDFGAKITKKRFFFFLNACLFDLPRLEKRNKELYIFEKGVFWSGPCRKSRVFRSGQGRKMGAFVRHIPVLSLYGSTPPPRVPTYRPSMNILNKQQTNIFLSLAIHTIAKWLS